MEGSGLFVYMQTYPGVANVCVCLIVTVGRVSCNVEVVTAMLFPCREYCLYEMPLSLPKMIQSVSWFNHCEVAEVR